MHIAMKMTKLPQNSPKNDGNDRRPSTVFKDGARSVDFVLAYRKRKRRPAHTRYRELFENELKQNGLQLEYDEGEEKEGDTENRMYFVKVHATWEALTRQAEFLRLQMPIMENDMPPRSPTWSTKILMKIFGRNPLALPKEMCLPRRDVFTDAFDRRREKQFLLNDENRDSFFGQAQKIAITWDIISGVAITVPLYSRKKSFVKTSINKVHTVVANGDSTQDNVSIADKQNPVKTIDVQYLLKEEIYTAAFPIHDCDVSTTPDDLYSSEVEKWPLRRYLFESWVKLNRWYMHQPLDEIRNYFGEKVALYFAWLGFYTQMLIPPAIVGLVSFLCGLFSLLTDPVTQDFCSDKSNFTQRTVCRLCPDTVCDYETVQQNCGLAKLNTVFDNESTVFFSLFMSVWAILFLEFWKRRQSDLCTRWDVSDAEFTQEKIRIEYQLKVSSTKRNPITNKLEPYLPFKSKFRRIFVSILAAMFFIFVVVALLAAVMVYKTLGPIVWRRLLYSDKEHRPILSPQLVASITASVANGIFIAIMTKVYFSVAWTLTNSEFPRTETEFENSYTYKVFIFQFINFYGALFYLAFIRGQFMTSPDKQGSRDARCPITGCLLDVSIQLAIVMIGKQALNNVVEIGLPKLRNWWRGRKLKKTVHHTQWELDHELDPVPPLHLTDDYLEMLIQYGFVTMFVAAFPLAPLFALLNNVFEIRLDARKHLCETRRCIPSRAKDLGPWFLLLTNVTKIAILTNALLIAFTTDFVDRILYAAVYSKDGSLTGYTRHVFSEFNRSDWSFEESSNSSEFCLYRDYRNPPGPDEYEQTKTWWFVLTVKLLFVILFEHTVLMLQTLIAFIIPDVPDHVIERQQREQYMQREKFMQQENYNVPAVSGAGPPEPSQLNHEVEADNGSSTVVDDETLSKTVAKPNEYGTFGDLWRKLFR